MHKLLMLSAALLGLSVGPVLAQTAAPGSAGAPPEAGAGGTAMTGMRPMRGQTRQPVGMRQAPRPASRATPASARAGTRGTGRAAPASVAQDDGVDVPRTGDYRGGAGSPSSTAASNITSRDTRSEIAPRLPDPGADANTPRALLAAADRALAANRTGAAQEALERAETRLLSRSTDPSMAGMPDGSAAVQAIGSARRALAARDVPAARSAINAAMSGLGS